eukprot:gene7206-34839_t
MWSPTAEDGTWMTPQQTTSSIHYGGSKRSWPQNNVKGDNRQYLSIWGTSSSAILGGCCADKTTR